MFKVLKRLFNKSKLVDVASVFVVKTRITSNYNDGTGLGPRAAVFMYFLATNKGNDYFELFSGKKLEMSENTHRNGMIIENFNTPYITKIEYLKEYLKDESIKSVTSDALCTFITNLNVLEMLKLSSKH